jgi:hypothetical protein
MTAAAHVRLLIAPAFCAAALLAAPPSDRPADAAEPAPAPAFAADGVAFLRKHCLSCHGERKPKAGVSLQGYADEAAVARDRKTWQRVLDVLAAGDMPPQGRPRPAPGDVAAFTKLVRGAFDRADRAAPPDPGRVTMRRLNRLEYRNTIRDLVGVDFDPAEDFPSDDVGYGFDNIGDVLSLPPVLMERYLAAAEAVMGRAITPDPPPVPRRGTGAKFTRPGSEHPPLKAGYRVVTAKPDGSRVETGPLFIDYRVPARGEYVFRTRLYAEAEGGAPVRVAVLAGCAKDAPGAASDDEAARLSGAAVASLRPFLVLKTLEVKARTPKEAEAVEVKVPTGVGPRHMAVALVKPEAGAPTPTLYVQHLSLEGPLDTRPPSHYVLLACDPAKPRAEQTREVLARFATRAYRRPATPEEVGRLVKVADAALARGEKWEATVQLAMQAALVSPKFLFRVELDDRPGERGPHPLDEYALACRLSYFLWASMPDDELFALAARGRLSAELESQARRMLRDPKASALVDSFVMQWLQVQNLKSFQPDPQRFPHFSEPLRAAMLQETRLFFEAILREDRSVLDVLGADFTFLNEPLARHYGIADTAGNLVGQKPTRPGGKPFHWNEFARVNVAGTGRGGVLTQASVLAVTSNPTRTSPVKRGRWVLEQLLGTPPPPPPPDVPPLERDGKPVAAGTLRQQMEAHRRDPACANCHAKMDPLGFGLENFDAVGAWRDQDAGATVDPSGILPDGSTFRGPAELKKILLAKKDLFAHCLAEKMLTYALGRGLGPQDRRAVDGIAAGLARDGNKFSALVVEVIRSDPFRLRRGKDQQ